MLSQSQSKFRNLTTKNLKDEEYDKLVQIYIASEKITWSNLTSDMFLAIKTVAATRKSWKGMILLLPMLKA